MDTFSLVALERRIDLCALDAETGALLLKTYGFMRGDRAPADLSYRVGRRGKGPGFFIESDHRERLTVRDPAEFLAIFDEDLAIELQKRRRDLYFLHSAVMSLEARAIMLVGRSGAGKSTMTWALSHHGFGYLSDELGPVDLDAMTVHPFPRAVCLKRQPPAPYPLPEGAIHTSRTIHIPTDSLPGPVGEVPTPLAEIFFLGYSPDAAGPSIRRISTAEAGARLYANALNQLAHPASGLDGAIRLAARHPCFELTTADLGTTCHLLIDQIGMRSPAPAD